MALPSGMIWEIRTDGDDRNSGGFNPARGGTDYTQQAAPEATYTDLQIQGTDTNLFSASRSFIAADLGNTVKISGSVGFNDGVYEVVAVTASGSATVDKSLGSVGSTSGIGRLGGAVSRASNSTFGNLLPGGQAVGGNIAWLRGGTYSVSAVTNWELGTTGGGDGKFKHLIGYGTTRGDGQRPKLQQILQTGGSNAIRIEDHWIVQNLDVTTIDVSSPNSGEDTGGIAVRIESGGTAFNVHASGGAKGFDCDVHTKLVRCSASGSIFGIFHGTQGGEQPAISMVEGCVATACVSGGFKVQDGGVNYLNCIAYNNIGDGFLEGNVTSSNGAFGAFYNNCTSYGNLNGLKLSHPFAAGTAFQSVPTVVNCIFARNRRYGVTAEGAPAAFQLLFPNADRAWQHRLLRNAFFGNTSGTVFNVPSGTSAVILSTDPFVGAASGNLALNEVALVGATLRTTGIPSSNDFFGTNTVSFTHLGAVAPSGFSAFAASGSSCPTAAPPVTGEDADNSTSDTGTGTDAGTVVAIDAATILEDSDGIPPDGGTTCDATPTIDWEDPPGPGPHLHRWTVRTFATSAFVSSGTVLGSSLVELPALDLGQYLFSVASTDVSGGSSSTAETIFEIIDCSSLVPLEVIEVPEFDLERVIVESDDYIRYLPRWLSIYGTATADASASLFFKFFEPTLEEFFRINRQTSDLLDETALLNVPVRVPRLYWHLHTRFLPRETVTVTQTASGITRSVRRSKSMYDFLTADDPVFVIGNTGHMIFRNLALRTVSLSGVAATGTLASQYRMPQEPKGMIRDTDVIFTSNGEDIRIRAGSRGIDPDKSTVQLTSAFTGTITFQYHSRTVQDAITISVSGQPFVEPSRGDLWNRFDEIAVIAGLERRRDEDNLIFRRRIHSRLLSQKGSQLTKVQQKIAQDLVLSTVLPWNGVTTLNFTTSGAFGIRRVDVPDFPEIATTTEELSRINAGQFTTSKRAWLPGYFLVVNGIPATDFLYPNLAISGNVVSFGQAVSGSVHATFRYRNYDVILTSNGFVSSVVPVSGNAVSGLYRVVLTKNVRAFNVDSDEFRLTELLNADGTPNGFFFQIRNEILDESPVHFSRARWGRDSYWLGQSEEKPQTEHLPSIFDIHLE